MKILICSDGHLPAERAVRFIRRPAAACGAQVTLLGIVEHPSDEASLTEAVGRSAQLLREAGVTVETVVRSGQPLAEIQRCVDETRFDFVLIGAERKGGGPFALSAKAYHLIKEIEPPVMVLAHAREQLKKILLCSSGYVSVERAIKVTGELAAKNSAEVTILHVMAEPPAIYCDLLNEEADVDRLLSTNSLLARNLRKELAAFGTHGIAAKIRLRHGFVAREILGEIETGDFDLVVTGSAPSQGALRTYVMGDVTSEIVNSAKCAVLVVRGDGAGMPQGFWAKVGAWFRQAKEG